MDQATPAVTLDYAGRLEPAVRPRFYPLTRLACVAFGALYPLAGLLFNAEPSEQSVPVDWQNGQPLARLTLVTLPGVGWPLWPFLLVSWASVLAAAAWPGMLGRLCLVRIGLWAGVVLGFEFALIVAIGLADGEPVAVPLPLLIQLAGLPVALAALAACFWLDRLPVRTLGIIVATCAAFVFAVAVFMGRGFLGLLFGPMVGVFIAAPLSVGGHAGMLWLSRRADYDDENDYARDRAADARLSRLAAATLLPLHLAGWAAAWHLSRRAYAALPLAQPDYCFVATAASRSSRSRRTGHRQLRTLQTFESYLNARRPRTHAVIRRHYNVIGPPLARRLATPRRADLAHRLLRLIEWPARVTLRRL